MAGLLSSCGLKRNNPLDPSSDPTIIVPEIISNLEIYPSPPGAANKFVEMCWRANPSYSTDGYYVYRGLGYFSTFTTARAAMAPLELNNSIQSLSTMPASLASSSLIHTHGPPRLRVSMIRLSV